MFQIRVDNYLDLQRTIETFKPTHVVSMITAMEPPVGVPHHLQIRVDDVPSEMPGYVHPQMSHLQTVLAFTADLVETDRVLIHCFAGISRSTAIAIAILIQHGMRYDEAFIHVHSIRPILMPNQAFIRLTDEHFKLGGKLVELVHDHRTAAFADETTLLIPSEKNPDTWINHKIQSLKDGI
jgi:predicted protein tyrosine phosphatase